MSGKWFNAVQYGVRRDDDLIDFDQVEALAKEHRPTLIIAGGSAYPRHIDFAKFRAIADEVGAIFMVDMAHFAGLVAAGEHPTPFGHAHVVTTTTHKTLRGPRGGMVLTDDEAIAKKINSAVFPGLQGGPLMHVIAAKAVAFGEALEPGFKTYAKAVIKNAQTLAGRLKERGADLVAGGTDTHLALVDLRPLGITGKDADEALERAGITCNKNGVPFDPLPPMQTSGIRVGSPAGTTRGFGEAEFAEIGDMVADVLAGVARATRRWSATSTPASAPCAPASPSIRTARHGRPNDDKPDYLGRATDEIKAWAAKACRIPRPSRCWRGRDRRGRGAAARAVDPDRADRRRRDRAVAAHQALTCAVRSARMKTAR